MIYVQDFKCNECGNIFTMRSDDKEYESCECGKSGKFRYDWAISWEAGSEKPNVEKIGSRRDYIEPTKVIDSFGSVFTDKLKKCKELALEIGWEWKEYTERLEFGVGEHVVHIDACFYVGYGNNGITANNFKYVINTRHSYIDINYIEEQTKRLDNLYQLLLAQKSGKYDMRTREVGKNILANLYNEGKISHYEWNDVNLEYYDRDYYI